MQDEGGKRHSERGAPQPGGVPRMPSSLSTPERSSGAEPPRSLLPTLSLPKGGGAIRGIGEKFQANVATGTGSLSVPIATSPGRAGFDVALSLSYDSGGGNGPFGIGWGLSVPQITRKTDKGLPRYDMSCVASGQDGYHTHRFNAYQGTTWRASGAPRLRHARTFAA
jgi:Salmonella virulence plasmid 65kDa B protein